MHHELLIRLQLKKLSIFTLKSYIGPLVLTFFISIFVLLMQFLWKYVDDFVGKGFEWYTIAELMLYASATFVPMALPLAVLLSSLMTFGNLGENYELVAIKSAGVSIQKLMRPMILFIVLLSISAFYFSNYMLPKANLQFKSLLSDVRNKKPAVTISEGIFNSDIGDFVIKVGKKLPDGKTIEQVIIYDHRNGNGNTNVTQAKSGLMEMTDDKMHLILTLFDGINYNEETDNTRGGDNKYEPLQITRFKKEIQMIDLSSFSFQESDKTMRKKSYEMLNVYQLAFYDDSLSINLDSTLDIFSKDSQEDYSYYYKYFGADKDSINKKPSVQETDSLKNILLSEVEGLSDEVKFAEIEKVKKIANLPKKSVPIDSLVVDTAALQLVLLDNFDSIRKMRILSGAISQSRNAAYQSNFSQKRIDGKRKYISKYRVEWHRKFTLSVACILMFFIGAPLGSIIRKGGLGMPMVVSIIMFVTYHVFTIIGEKAVKSLLMEPWEGMWLASFIYLPMGVFFTWKATTDAPLFDSESWQKIFSKVNLIGNLFKNKNAEK